MSCFVWLAVCDVALSHVNTTSGAGVTLATENQTPDRPYKIQTKAQGYADDLMAFGKSAEEVLGTAQAILFIVMI